MTKKKFEEKFTEVMEEAATLLKAVPAAPKVDFDVWFAMREKKIPQQHKKEILWADFKARGCARKETVARFDAALAAYGVKL